ncbi:MAG: universal stress protein [Gaiellaceae bacterium]
MIVVGVDGSRGSYVALEWALAEAKLRGVPLRVVNAYHSPALLVDGLAMSAPGVPASGATSEDFDRMRAASEADARRVLERALADVDARSEGVAVESEAVEGTPSQVLIAAARDAELLVVGSRGRGGFAGLLLGSVSQQCAQHPPCPVVILPPAPDADEA